MDNLHPIIFCFQALLVISMVVWGTTRADQVKTAKKISNKIQSSNARHRHHVVHKAVLGRPSFPYFRFLHSKLHAPKLALAQKRESRKIHQAKHTSLVRPAAPKPKTRRVLKKTRRPPAKAAGKQRPSKISGFARFLKAFGKQIGRPVL